MLNDILLTSPVVSRSEIRLETQLRIARWYATSRGLTLDRSGAVFGRSGGRVCGGLVELYLAIREHDHAEVFAELDRGRGALTGCELLMAACR